MHILSSFYLITNISLGMGRGEEVWSHNFRSLMQGICIDPESAVIFFKVTPIKKKKKRVYMYHFFLFIWIFWNWPVGKSWTTYCCKSVRSIWKYLNAKTLIKEQYYVFLNTICKHILSYSIDAHKYILCIHTFFFLSKTDNITEKWNKAI